MTKRKSTFSRSSPKQSQLNQVVPINDDNLQIVKLLTLYDFYSFYLT